MLKTKLNMTIASALVVGGMVAVLSTTAQAAMSGTTGATLQMYDKNGTTTGLAPDTTVVFTWDANPGVMTWGVTSNETFFAENWTASNGKLYYPGTYVININGDGSNEKPYNASYPLANGDGNYTFTVPAGMLGGNIDFSWSTTLGIDVFVVWGPNGMTSMDVDGDGIPGARMVDGAFPGMSANFTPNTPIPVPAAAWLFGSGLLGLVGVARRRNKVSA
jgi:hypothetical protein